MPLHVTILFHLYIAVIVYLSVYGGYQAVMLYLAHRARKHNTPPPHDGREPEMEKPPALPRVTIQLPLFNEKFVVERAVRALADLDYPRDRLQIQVLDDSTDDTVSIARAVVDRHREEGLDIEYIHRDSRDGYKAGALANGLGNATGEYVAVFDADFLPHRRFLKRIFLELRVFDDPAVAFAQTRWEFINKDHSWMTRAQAIMHDMVFFVDQVARSGNGLLFNFNGSGGIWRRSSLDAAGGWSHDTIAEDLDLSYRAGSMGWRGVYYVNDTAPNELPTDLLAFKRQQKRWARGSIQCAKKLLPRITSAGLTPAQKIFAYLHLLSYTLHPSLVLFVLVYPLLALTMVRHTGAMRMPLWVQALSPLGLSFVVSLVIPQVIQKRGASTIVRDVALTVLVATGVSFSNTVAVLKGFLVKRSGTFERTPKERMMPSSSTDGTPRAKYALSAYTLKPDLTILGEIFLALYCGVFFALLLPVIGFWAMPMLLYATSYGTVSAYQLLHWSRLRSLEGGDMAAGDVVGSTASAA